MNKSTRILIAAITGSALTSGVYAQALSDGVPSLPGEFDTVIDVTTAISPAGSILGDNTGATLTQVNLNAGGDIAVNSVDYHYVEFNIDGGTTGTSEDYFNSEINLISSAINFHSNIHANSTVNVSGGTLLGNWDLYGTVNMNGGLVQYGYVKNGGTLNFNAGASANTSSGLIVESGGTLNLNGGTISTSADLLLGSIFNMTGGSIGSTLDIGGVTHISGGTIGINADAESGSVVTITGGTFGTGFNARGGSVVNISGGIHGNSFDAENGSVVTISGGSFGSSFNPNAGSEVNISGGTFGNYFLNEGSDTDISGGSYGIFRNFSGSAVNFFGTEFLIDGVAIDGLTLGDTFIITDRNVNLTGVLADGSTIDFDLTSLDAGATFEWFASDSTVTVTLVPEPGSLALLGLGALAMVRRRR